MNEEKKYSNSFNIFDYINVKQLAEDLKLNDDEGDWILEKIDDRGTFRINLNYEVEK